MPKTVSFGIWEIWICLGFGACYLLLILDRDSKLNPKVIEEKNL